MSKGKGKSLLNMNNEELEKKYSVATPHVRQSSYWWVFGTLPNGKTLRLGKFYSEDEAENTAGNKFVKYEVIELPTSDGATATSMYKGRRLKTMSALEAMNPIRVRGKGTGIE